MADSISPKPTKGKSAQDFLQEVIDNKTLPLQMRLDASKALLPYTAKRTPLTTTVNQYQHTITDERLRSLDDTELRQLIELVRKASSPGINGDGAESKEVQSD